ncbi:MAG: hypothetical protein V4471_00825 [Pseudomonadota bacterium]
MSRYPLNPELNTTLQNEWDKIGLSKEIQDSLLNLMDIATVAILDKESRRIAQCLLDEGLSPEKIKRITGCSVENLCPACISHHPLK